MTNSHVKDFSHLMLKVVVFYYQGLSQSSLLVCFNDPYTFFEHEIPVQLYYQSHSVCCPTFPCLTRESFSFNIGT